MFIKDSDPDVAERYLASVDFTRLNAATQLNQYSDRAILQPFSNDEMTEFERRWEKLTFVMDNLNSKFGKRVVTLGPWTTPPGGFAGGKIAFTRIPSAEDFY